MSGSLTDVGIDDEFIKKTRDQITPGTSALFVMSRRRRAGQGRGGVPGREAGAAVHEPYDEQEKALREAFAE